MFIFAFFSPFKYSRARAIRTYSSRTKLYRAPLINDGFPTWFLDIFAVAVYEMLMFYLCKHIMN